MENPIKQNTKDKHFVRGAISRKVAMMNEGRRMSQLVELKKHPVPTDTYELKHEFYNEENVKQSIILGRSTRKIASMFQVSEQFVIKCRRELRNKGAI